MFREQVSEAVLTFVLSECYEADANFDHTALRRREGPLWKLLTERPMHLLDPQFDSWDELLMQAVDDVIARAKERRRAGRTRTWAEYNVTAYPSSAGGIDAIVRTLAEHAGRPRCPATCSPCGCTGARKRRPSGSSSRPGARRRASCTCRRDRAATRSRRSTRTHTTRG